VRLTLFKGGKKMYELLGTLRSKENNCSVKKLRRIGKIPCILYGGSLGEVPFLLEKNQVEKYMLRYGQQSVMQIELGGKMVRGLIKEVQRHMPLNNIIHIDFKQVDEENIMERELSLGEEE
jgi:large subunit ribosomal protein L25